MIYLDTLKISNITSEGPSKTATGGMAADTLLKYGKKFNIEMQDAMGRYEVLTELYGANAGGKYGKEILAITDRFPGEKTIVGTTFVIDQATGAKQPLKVIIPIYTCDGIFNLTQDAEGDVTTFDMNGQILRFESDAHGKVDATGKYEVGSDNAFYFFCTEDAFKKIKADGYRAAFETDKAVEDKEETATIAKLDAMLAKFGVVTVMDVEIYEAKRHTEAIAEEVGEDDKITKYGYRIGEWDAVETFKA